MLNPDATRAETGAQACCTASATPSDAINVALPASTVVLINPYELGRQPFALAEASAWLKRAAYTVACVDLALQKLDPALLGQARAIVVYLGMHTATRIALSALPRIRQLAPHAALAAFGLYAPMNESRLRALGVSGIFGGESEPDIVAWVEAACAQTRSQATPLTHMTHMTQIRHDKIEFLTPDRGGLPALQRYAHVVLADGSRRVAGFVDSTRGCKHMCRHCPVVPIYEGKFRVVPQAVVMADIEQQIAAGAQHISFGDHDFFNGPTHAMNIVRALHEAYPHISYDATIKIQHLVAHAQLLPELRRTGCLFIVAAAEAVDDAVLQYLAKNHTRADFYRAVNLLNEAGIALAPTWVAFHPWTTLESYLDLLHSLVELQLVQAVPPIQLAIRLLIPSGSKLLTLPGFGDLIEPFDETILGYPWRNRDARVDALQKSIQAYVAAAEQSNVPRAQVFEHIWELAHAALDRAAPALHVDDLGKPIPHMSEPWYCCAEPTEAQLESF